MTYRVARSSYAHGPDNLLHPPKRVASALFFPADQASAISLSAEEIALIERMLENPIVAHAGEVVVMGGEWARPSFLLSGWACRFRPMPDGRRQVLGIILPGDPVSLVLQPDKQPSAFGVMAITRIELAPAEELRNRLLDMDSSLSRLNAACIALVHADLGRAFDQITRMGRQSAYDRVGQFLLDLYCRLDMIGQVSENSFHLPMTQEMIAQAVGLSHVHVNRTLQEMRRSGVIATHGGWVTLMRPQMISAAAEYARA